MITRSGVFKVFLCVIFFITLSSIDINAQTFKAGAAVRVITPDPFLPVSGGVGQPKNAVEKKGDLFVRAVVFEKGKTKVAIVNIDNLGWSSALGERSRSLIKG